MARKTKHKLILYCVCFHRGGPGFTRVFEDYAEAINFMDVMNQRGFMLHFWEL